MSSRIFPLAKTFLTFVLVGPPVGALTFIGAFAAAGMTRAEGATAMDAVWIMLFAMIYAVPLSYLIGVIPAAIVGLIIGAWTAWRGRVPYWLALAVGTAAGLWLFAAGGGPFPEPTSDNPEAGWQAIRLLTLVATCLVPTMVGWALTRSYTQAPPG